jgi:hypothetical protein
LSAGRIRVVRDSSFTYCDFLHWTAEAAFGEVGEDVFVADGYHDDDDYGVEVGHDVVWDVMTRSRSC